MVSLHLEMLSQIEKRTANPSLNTIREIAHVLEVPIFKFFMAPEKEEDNITILKKEKRKIIESKNLRYELLSPEVETNIECMKMILQKMAQKLLLNQKLIKVKKLLFF